ncbi:hypothetical protein [Kitasatospora setae]|uniref:hypothetical protein n=1 Tax=Kitasatospora setae TaxID=2066 RepID=UPI00200ED73B|nr:hypothetical protein [Kitasatospora setae]
MDTRLLADLVERSAELKGELVAFGQSARFDRWLTPLLLEAAGPGRELDETEAIRIIDRFLLRYRLPDGSTVVDRFVTGRRDLTEAERELLLGWREAYAAEIAEAALRLAVSEPRLVFRNPEKVEQGWQQMREDRAAFVEFCGGDELVLSPAAAEELLNAYYRHRWEAAPAARPGRGRGGRLPGGGLPGADFPVFELPPGPAAANTVGVIYDEVDGLNFYADYGMLRDLFADPHLTGRRKHQDLLRVYLREESIAPLPIRRLAAAHPGTADTVFRKLLRQPGFTWAEHGEELLRRRKPWYYADEPRPGVSVIGERLGELAAGGRR